MFGTKKNITAAGGFFSQLFLGLIKVDLTVINVLIPV